MAKLTGNFNWNVPEIRTSFVQGEDALAIYNSLEGSARNGICYDNNSKTLIGSNIFASARIDSNPTLRKLGIRVANLRDLSRPEIMEKVEDTHYTDAPILVLRSTEDSYEPNLPLIKQLTEQIEEAKGKLQLPVMISGFDVKQIKDKGYGIVIVPRDDFKAFYDERLAGKNNGKSFSDVDELGLPKFDRNGKRIFFARNQGLSRLYFNRSLNLDSDNGSLADSDGYGRVVLVSGEAPQKNLEGKI